MFSFMQRAPRAPRTEVDPVTGAVLEDEALRAASLSALRELLAAAQAKDASLRLPRSDDRFLLAFLRARKHDVPRTLPVVLSFAKFWYSHPEVVEGLCAAKVRSVWNLGLMGFLPGTRDKFGNAVTVLRMGGIDFGSAAFKEAYTALNMMRLSLYILSLMFESDDMQLHGCCYVETLEGFSFANAMKMSANMSSADQKEMLSVGVDTFPMRIRDIYVIHEPWYFHIFFGIVRPFLKAKLIKRMHLLGHDVKALHAFVDPAGLPADFGGALPYDLSGLLDELEKREHLGIGGFAFPLSMDDPMGENKLRGTPGAEMGGAAMQGVPAGVSEERAAEAAAEFA